MQKKQKKNTLDWSSFFRKSCDSCPRYSRNPQPVCGKDGNIYGNRCLAECKGVSVAYVGICTNAKPIYRGNTLDWGSFFRKSCDSCPKYVRGNPTPVCGKDGNIYGSRCHAECKGISVAYEGICANPKPIYRGNTLTMLRRPFNRCLCPRIYRPVCGVNGKSYGNECSANCANVDIAYHGKCETSDDSNTLDWSSFFRKSCDKCPKFVTGHPSPVCGKDGKTYGDRCQANCRGVSVAYDRICSR